MIKNMGNTDRILRILLVLVIGVLYFTDAISGTVALGLGLLSAIFVLTGVVGLCPLYMPFRFTTGPTVTSEPKGVKS